MRSRSDSSEDTGGDCHGHHVWLVVGSNELGIWRECVRCETSSLLLVGQTRTAARADELIRDIGAGSCRTNRNYSDSGGNKPIG